MKITKTKFKDLLLFDSKNSEGKGIENIFSENKLSSLFIIKGINYSFY
mgnify:CR=1 FL=1